MKLVLHTYRGSMSSQFSQTSISTLYRFASQVRLVVTRALVKEKMTGHPLQFILKAVIDEEKEKYKDLLDYSCIFLRIGRRDFIFLFMF